MLSFFQPEISINNISLSINVLVRIPKDLSKIKVAYIKHVLHAIEKEDSQRLKPLQQLLNKGETLLEENGRFMDNAENIIDELLVLRKIEAEGDVSKSATKVTKDDLKRLEPLVSRFNQTKPPVSSTEGAASRFSHY